MANKPFLPASAEGKVNVLATAPAEQISLYPDISIIESLVSQNSTKVRQRQKIVTSRAILKRGYSQIHLEVLLHNFGQVQQAFYPNFQELVPILTS